jgi:hypothetical protein
MWFDVNKIGLKIEVKRCYFRLMFYSKRVPIKGKPTRARLRQKFTRSILFDGQGPSYAEIGYNI